MAHPPNLEELQSVTLSIESNQSLPFKNFIEIQKYFASALADVDRGYFKSSGKISWSVLKASMNSPYRCQVLARPAQESVSDDDVISLVRAFGNGLKEIERQPKCPRFFSNKAINSLKNISKKIDGDSVCQVSLFGQGWSSSISGDLLRNIGEILEAKHEIYDSVEGNLLAINLYEKRIFRLYETHSGSKAIECSFPEEMLEEAINALQKRVYVYGLVQEREDGEKVGIKVKEIEILPHPWEVPTLAGILSIGRN